MLDKQSKNISTTVLCGRGCSTQSLFEKMKEAENFWKGDEDGMPSPEVEVSQGGEDVDTNKHSVTYVSSNSSIPSSQSHSCVANNKSQFQRNTEVEILWEISSSSPMISAFDRNACVQGVPLEEVDIPRPVTRPFIKRKATREGSIFDRLAEEETFAFTSKKAAGMKDKELSALKRNQ